MATVESLSFVLSLSGLLTEALDLTTPSESIGIEKLQSFVDGTGDGQVNRVWHQTLTGNSETLDLTGGLTDGFGDILTFTKVKLLLIHNKNTGVGNDFLIRGNFFVQSVLGGVTAYHYVGPKGILVLLHPNAGYTVTASSADVITLDAADAYAAGVDVVIVGTV